MRKGDRVLARFEKKQVVGEIVLSTTISGDTLYFVKWESGSCWFGASLLKDVPSDYVKPSKQLSLFDE